MAELLRRLHTETFVLDLRDELMEFAPIPGFTIELRDSTTLEVSVTRDSGLSPLFEMLSARGVEVLSLRNKQNRLEQLFIGLVQAEAEAGAGRNPV